jgi:hypothetical protein
MLVGVAFLFGFIFVAMALSWAANDTTDLVFRRILFFPIKEISRAQAPVTYFTLVFLFFVAGVFLILWSFISLFVH